MRHRMLIAALALIGTLLATYLWLWKIGKIGVMVCGTGSCEAVQLSSYGMLLGQPVAFYGVGGYLSLLVVSMVGLQPAWLNRRGPTLLLAALSGAGVLFTIYLSYIEGAVLHAWCRWCLTSAAIITAIFAVSSLSLRTSPSASPPRRDQPAS